jgi:hypothetical protein
MELVMPASHQLEATLCLEPVPHLMTGPNRSWTSRRNSLVLSQRSSHTYIDVLTAIGLTRCLYLLSTGCRISQSFVAVRLSRLLNTSVVSSLIVKRHQLKFHKSGSTFAWFTSLPPNFINGWVNLVKFHKYFYTGVSEMKLAYLTAVRQ